MRPSHSSLPGNKYRHTPVIRHQQGQCPLWKEMIPKGYMCGIPQMTIVWDVTNTTNHQRQEPSGLLVPINRFLSTLPLSGNRFSLSLLDTKKASCCNRSHCPKLSSCSWGTVPPCRRSRMQTGNRGGRNNNKIFRMWWSRWRETGSSCF